MKKILFFCSALFCFATTLANAQVTTSGGVKTQANYSRYRLSGMSDMKSSYGVGAGIGGFVKIEFGENFAIQPELLLNFNNSKLKDESSSKLRYMGLEVPVYAVGQIQAGSGKLFLGAGPYVAYGLKNKAKNGTKSNLYKKEDGRNQAVMTRFDYGIGGLLGYEFENGFMINAGYQFGLKDNFKASGSSMKTSAFSLGFAYKF